jgi:hypothetical protein
VRHSPLIPSSLLFAAALLAALLTGCESMKSAAGGSDLTSLLTKQLGVTQAQADGGVGSMLQLAKEKLTTGEFDSIAKAIPGSQKYLDSAKQALGGGKIGDASGLQSAFSKLGMSPDMVNKFKPIVVEYGGQVGGPQVKSLLQTALA